jgi:hypothetical protein
VFELPVFEFQITQRIKINNKHSISLIGYIDMFGHYFDMSMFTHEIVHTTRDKYEKYKMPQMLKSPGSGRDTEDVSYMFQ